MPLLLNIDTATETASVCISRNGNVISLKENGHQKEHASFVHTAIKWILTEADVSLPDLDGFAVTAGPGSYTGLRVGMAAAKGFCYALSKPLLTENTLKVMAKAALQHLEEDEKNVLLCPMIDARRMEVFTAIYDCSLNNLTTPAPVELSATMFNEYLLSKRIVFFGSGSEKFKEIHRSVNSIFKQIEFNASHLGKLADENFKLQQFSDVSYSQPDYFKEFYSTRN